MKKTIAYLLISFSLLFAVGCQSGKPTYEQVPSKAAMHSSNFNQEHYVWETFLFPTNRTSGAR